MADLFDQNSMGDLFSEERIEQLTLDRAGELFETVYMPSRNLAARTRVEYQNDLKQLTVFLQAEGFTTVEQVGLRHLQSFLAQLDAKGLTGITRRRKTASIRTFFSFLHKSAFIRHNPTRELIPPERDTNEPRYLSVQEYQALQRACSDHPRDAAIIELLLQTGMRLAEVVRVTSYDLELPARITHDSKNVGTLRIQGKGTKNRTLPLNYKACQALRSWLEVRPGSEEQALFVTKFHQPMGPRGLELLVQKYLDEAGIHNASVHTLRHTMATHHVIKGTDLEILRDMLGHADLRSTTIYVSTAKEAVKRAMQNNAL